MELRCRSCHHGFEAEVAGAREARKALCPRCGARDARPWKFPVLEEDAAAEAGACERPVGPTAGVLGSLAAAVARSPARR